ncbi:MAG: hypothetical protein K0R58_4298 [Ramlibacter sp.]|jgi:hypothetical protein|nr:hypothetical protein [Ramlibacter sp.]
MGGAVGLSDRDYMRDRARENFNRERAFRPSDKGAGWPWIVLFWIGLAFILFKIYSAYGPTVRRAVAQPVHVQQEDIEPAAPAQRREETRTFKSEDPPARTFTPSAAPPPPSVSNQAISTNTIYLCRAYNGGTFWAQAHCNQHNALIERIAYVPPSLPFDQQVAIASQQQRDGAALVSSNTVTHSSRQGQSAPQHECKALEALITSLDAMARQPQSAQTHDWIAGKRKDARDRQFRLRC